MALCATVVVWVPVLRSPSGDSFKKMDELEEA